MNKALPLFASLLLLATFNASAQLDEPLEPEKAFAFSATTTGPDSAEARWVIAEGYYMYRDKISFAVEGGGVSLGEIKIPTGKLKKDEFFGEVQVFTKELVVPIKLTGGGPFTLVANSQGCNEPIGICYQPLTQKVKLELAGGGAIEKPSSLSSLSQLLDKGTGGGGEDLLDPDAAFAVTVVPVTDKILRAEFVVADGYYLYRDKTSFQLNADNARLGDFELPAGVEKEDEFFGKTEVYRKLVSIELPVLRSTADAADGEVVVGYQGCADQGVCYPPITKTLQVKLPAAGTVVADDGSDGGVSSRTYWLAVLSAFGIGLLLTFTPCVLPMIPILSSIIVGQGGQQQITKARGGTLAIIYVLGTAVTYTAAGIFAGYTGGQLQAYFQNVWAIGIFSALLILLALSMFGFYEIQMPSFIQSKLQTRSQSIKGGSATGVFVMGLVSALIVGACVSPLLMAALGVAIASKDPVLGGLIMFSMAMGMGVILVAIGFGAGFLLPRAGLWMEKVKHVFGVMLLGVAIYLISLVAREWSMYLWAALLIVTAVYLGALQSLPEGASGWRYLWKGIGVFLLIWGVLALLGGMSGHHDITRPLPLDRMAGPAQGPVAGSTVGTNPLFKKVGSEVELDQQLAVASAAGKPVLIDYYADWCNDCVRMENTTFADVKVRQLLEDRFVVLKVDVTDPNNADTNALKTRYGVFGPPATLFISPGGTLLKELNFYGYRNTPDFLTVLDKVLANS